MSETTRPCLVCDDAPELHDTDPATAEHVYEPENPTPAEASTIVAWVRENHGDEAAAECAANLIAEGAEATGLVAELARDERASILADLADEEAEAGWQLPAPARGWVLTEAEEAEIRNAQ